MTRLPLARSTPLTLPQVWTTRPSLTRSKLAWQTCLLSSSSMGDCKLWPDHWPWPEPIPIRSGGAYFGGAEDDGKLILSPVEPARNHFAFHEDGSALRQFRAFAT